MRLFLALVLAVAASAAERPNILLLSVDDMNDWVGALGHENAATPNIDRLAAQGQLFTNAHAPSPKCNPSRTAILSGKMPSTTGVYGNSEWWKANYPDLLVLPRYFREQGYYAAGGGKVFHHTPGFNPPDSWDEHSELVHDLRTAGFLVPYREPRHISSFDWGPEDKDLLEMGDGATVRWAEEFLSRKHLKPFFLAVGLFQPHLPFYAPKKLFAEYPLDNVRVPVDKPGDLDDVPPIGREMAAYRTNDLELINRHGDMPAVVQAYLAGITHADALVGMVLEALERSAYAQNTIVVFWSDHGYHFGEKHHFAKNTLWERSSRVPFIWKAPGLTQPGARSSRPVSLIDIFPTLVDLAGLPAPDGLEGVSLRPLLDNPNLDWNRPAVMTFGRGNHAVRSQTHRYIRYADGSEELYDHRSDPEEYRNLARDPALRDVKTDLARWLPRTEHPGAKPKSAFIFDEAAYSWQLKPEALR